MEAYSIHRKAMIAPLKAKMTIDLINFISTKVTDFIKTVYDVRPVFKRLIYSNDTLNIDVSIPFNEVIKHIYYDGLKNDKLFNKYIDFEENFAREKVLKNLEAKFGL